MSIETESPLRAAIPRLLVVGDIALFREGMHAALSHTGQFEVAGAVALAEALELVRNGAVDVVVLDTSRRRAFSHARLLQQARPGIGIVAFGVSGIDDTLACAEAGVRAFVGEDGTIEAICEAALLAARGLSVCPPEVTARLLDRFATISRDTEVRGQDRLTLREGEIARLVADGLSNKQIARQLTISPATVKNHVHSILVKFDRPGRGAIGRQLRAGPAMAACGGAVGGS